MNLIMIIGNLTKKPEMIEGQNFAKMIVAVNDTYTKKDGTRDVNYFNVLVWNKLAENCCKYLDKGGKVAVVGKTRNHNYEAKDGTIKFVSEVIASEVEFLSNKKQENNEFIPLSEDEASDIPF